MTTEGYSSRYVVVLESLLFIDDAGVQKAHVTVGIKGRSKLLVSGLPELVLKLKEWNPALGLTVGLYYTGPDRWDLVKPVTDEAFVDKYFKKEEL